MKAEAIAVEAHQRGAGCEWCRYGLVDAPPPSPKVPLSEARRAQWSMGLLVTCNCEMGKAYEQWLGRSTDEGVSASVRGTKGRDADGPVHVSTGQSWVSRSAQGIAAS